MPFSPSIWAPDPHTQSAMGSECAAAAAPCCHACGPCTLWLCCPPIAVLRTLTARGSYTRQLVMTSDHGTLGLDWWCGADKATWAAPDAPIVLFIHGINGEQQQQQQQLAQQQCLPAFAARQGGGNCCTDTSVTPTLHLTRARAACPPSRRQPRGLRQVGVCGCGQPGLARGGAQHARLQRAAPDQRTGLQRHHHSRRACGGAEHTQVCVDRHIEYKRGRSRAVG